MKESKGVNESKRENQKGVKNSDESNYPKKLTGNPIESSGLPDDAKAIQALRFGKEDGDIYCYIGYGNYNKNTGPTWIVKHRPSPCKFLVSNLINEEAICRYLVMNDGSSKNLYIPGSDSNEQRAPSLAIGAPFSVIGRRDSLSGQLYTAVCMTEDLKAGSVTDPAEYEYTAVSPGNSSDFSIAINGEQCVAFHNDLGRLYYCFGQIDNSTGSPTISWEPAIHFEIDGMHAKCEQLSLAMNGDAKFVLVYRYFYKLYSIAGYVNFDKKTVENCRGKTLDAEGKNPSVSVNDKGFCICVYTDKLSEKIQTRIGGLTAGAAGINWGSGTIPEINGNSASAAIDNNQNCVLCVKSSDLNYFSANASTPPFFNWGTAITYVDNSHKPSLPAIAVAPGGDCIEMHQQQKTELKYIVGDFIGKQVNTGTPNVDYKTVNSGWAACNFYKKSGATWEKYRTIPGNHTFDMCYYNDILFAAIGQTGEGCLVKSSDNGATWESAINQRISTTWSKDLFRLGGALYALGTRSEPCRTYKLDSTKADPKFKDTDDITFSKYPHKIVEVSENVVFYISNDEKLLFKLQYTAGNGSIMLFPVNRPQNTRFIRDIVVKDDAVYILAQDTDNNVPQIYKSTDDGNNWTLYGSSKNQWMDNGWNEKKEPTSLALREGAGDIYIGTDNGSIWVDIKNK